MFAFFTLTPCTLFLLQVRYTGYRDRPQEERQVRFQNGCREGHTEIAFVATGTNIQLVFNPASNGYSTVDLGRECDFDKEHGKVRLKIYIMILILIIINYKRNNFKRKRFYLGGLEEG